MSKKDLSLDKYGISKERYRELFYFCMQYGEWKESIAYGIRPACTDNISHGSGISNPTEQMAIHNQKALENCRLIEDVAKAAGGYIWKYILKNVTEGIAYEYMNVPCGRRYFYEIRKKFFFMLSQRK